MDKVDEMPAGRELDALVAERIFNWEWLERDTDNTRSPRKGLFAPVNSEWVRFNFHPPSWRPAKESTPRFSDWDETCAIRAANGYDLKQRGLPHYSTDIGAAWEVFLRLKGTWRLAKTDSWPGANGPAFHCHNDEFKPGHIWVTDLSAPLAICRAALRAMEDEAKVMDNKISQRSEPWTTEQLAALAKVYASIESHLPEVSTERKLSYLYRKAALKTLEEDEWLMK